MPFPKYSTGIISAKGGVGKTFAALKIADLFLENDFINLVDDYDATKVKKANRISY